jgi:Skp family chaperone for outer membrane proteins
VKIGYFNLALVKASYPEAAGSETLRNNAEAMLRRDVEEGNKRLQKAQEDKKPKEEIEKMARDLQAEINAKQQALIQLVQTQAAIATQNIAQAVNAVARDKGLDLVVDGAGVFAGGDKIVNNGVDITDEVVKRLQPQALKAPSGGGAAPAPAGGGGGGAK